MDPRTPVIAGVGQLTHRPSPADPSTWTEPLALMADALALAGDDASATSGARSALLERLDVLTAIPGFTWSVADPALATAERLGITARSTRVTYPGGTVPQRAVFDAAARIATGEIEVAAVVGAEAMKSRDLARRAGGRTSWFTQGDGVAAAEVVFEIAASATDDDERAAGLALPVLTYALFEHALRRGAGRSRAAHAARLGALAARMSAVASTNPDAWIPGPIAPATITTASSSNRMVSVPYTKLLTSNVVVDMGAAVIVCSLGAARAAGVPDDQLVFPLKGAHAKEQWLVSSRDELSRSLAMAACKRTLFGEGLPGPDELALIDLYSCFPCAVQMGAGALGLDVLADERPPTVTGGMTFFGGPGNNYVTHSLATMVARLRERPGATGLVTGLGWYASTHAWGTYSTAPPPSGFRAEDVQGAVDVAPLREVDPAYEGEAVVEAYTVFHDREAGPARVVAALRTPSDARRIVASDDAALAAEVEAADPLDDTVVVRAGTPSLR